MLETWNLGYSTGFSLYGLWIPRGVVIPTFEGGDVWSFKIRLAPGEPFKCQGCKAEQTQPGPCPACGKSNKYRGVKGNRPGLFGAGTLHGSRYCFITEGEFDAMHLWAALGKTRYAMQAAVITTGASSHFIDPVTWGTGLLGIQKFISIQDADAAGEKAFAHFNGLTNQLTRARFPESINGQPIKDVTDFIKAGGDLPAWINFQMEAL